MSEDSGLWHTNDEWLAAVDKAPISGTSKASYKKQLRSCLRVFAVDGATGLSTILSKPKIVERAKHIGDNSLRSYLAALVSLFKRGEEQDYFKRSDPEIAELQGAWAEQLQGSSKRYLKRVDNNEESERERETRTTLDEWKVAFEASFKKDPLSQETLILALHALVLPPLRGGDLARVHIGYTDEGNCAYRDPHNDDQTLLLIRDHKTSRSFGPLKRTLRGRIVDILRDGADEHPREWLFVSQTGAPYSESGFSSWKSAVFKEAFKRPVTTNSLRHAYISGMDRQNQSLAEARELASSMGHGLYTQRQYVRFDRGR